MIQSDWFNIHEVRGFGGWALVYRDLSFVLGIRFDIPTCKCLCTCCVWPRRDMNVDPTEANVHKQILTNDWHSSTLSEGFSFPSEAFLRLWQSWWSFLIEGWWLPCVGVVQVVARPKQSVVCERHPRGEKWQATSRAQTEPTVEHKRRCFSLIDTAFPSSQHDCSVICPPNMFHSFKCKTSVTQAWQRSD